MTHFTSSINPLPVLAEILGEPRSANRIVVIQTLSAEMEQQLIGQLHNKRIFPADSFTGYEQQLNSNSGERFLALWNPTEWQEWDEGDIRFPGGDNVTTLIIDNSQAATYMADEIWEIDDNGQAEKFADTCFF